MADDYDPIADINSDYVINKSKSVIVKTNTAEKYKPGYQQSQRDNLNTIREQDETSNNDRSELIDALVFNNDDDTPSRLNLLDDHPDSRKFQTEQKGLPDNQNGLGISPSKFTYNFSNDSPLKNGNHMIGKHKRLNSNPFELSSQVGNDSSSKGSGKFSGTSSFLRGSAQKPKVE